MDPMNDAALERDIERALAVDPSPEFVARVRVRIAEEPALSSRRFGWLFAGVGAAAVAAAVVLAVFVMSPARRNAPASAPLLTSRSIAAAVVVPVVSRTGLDRSRGANDERPTTEDARRTTHDERRTTAILFDTRETLALQRLIAGVREARVDLTPLLKEAPMAVQPIDNLAIPPIAIEPLVPGGVEGERP